jgi:hypothetical protein
MEITYSNYGAIVINKQIRGQEDTMVYRKPVVVINNTTQKVSFIIF